MKRLLPILPLVLALAAPAAAQTRPKITIGSKAFAESWILGEAIALLAAQTGTVAVEHRSNLGGTEIVFQALRSGGIDLYPDYTGTVAEVLMKAAGRPTRSQMRAFLEREGIGMTDTLGFNDGYALAVLPAVQAKYGLRQISDLARHPQLRFGLTHEFIGRQDGWPGLQRHYHLPHSRVRGIQHDLAYQAIAAGEIEVMDVYTTDAQIERLGLRLLEDDRRFFPRYDAVLLYRLDLPRRAPEAFLAIERLIGALDEPQMMRANARVALEKKSPREAAIALLGDLLAQPPASLARTKPNPWLEISANTARHLQLVGISLLAAILIGVPLGILAARSRWLATLALSGSGLLQTIPSLALLAFLIPRFGIGAVTALVALFLYSLLPIVRNTYTGLTTIPPNLSEAAQAIGLTPAARLWLVELPMASPAIMAGIKTSAVINVGTATLAALIGAGGLGEPILRGISLVDHPLILQGALPAALLALAVQGAFDLLDRLVIPRGLRLAAEKR